MGFGVIKLGEVDAFRGERCCTRFFYMGILFFPLDGHYETADEKFEVPVRGRSVGIAYLRVYSIIIALLSLVFLIGGLRASSYSGMRDLIPWTILGLAVSVPAIYWSMFRMGHVPEADVARRELLAAATGLSAFPEWLPDHVVTRTRRRLLETWEASRKAWRQRSDWREVATRGSSDRRAARFVAVLAAYEAAFTNEPEAAALSETAWQHAVAVA